MAAQTAATTARIRGRGQLTLPAEVREALHAHRSSAQMQPRRQANMIISLYS
jgi:hypothetical protein